MKMYLLNQANCTDLFIFDIYFGFYYSCIIQLQDCIITLKQSKIIYNYAAI